MYLLHHEMLITALFSSFGIPLDSGKFFFYDITVKVVKNNIPG